MPCWFWATTGLAAGGGDNSKKITNPGTDGSGTTRSVTQGSFDLAPQSGGSLPVVPEWAGSRVGCTIGGVPWNAALAIRHIGGTFGLGVATSNLTCALTIELDGVTATGTYALSNAPPLRAVIVTDPSGQNGTGPCCCYRLSPQGVGTVTVTSYTPERVKGTFSATLAAEPGPGPIGPVHARLAPKDLAPVQRNPYPDSGNPHVPTASGLALIAVS